MNKVLAASSAATLLLLSAALATHTEACTIGVADGTVTADGRPLLWKSRMVADDTPNELVHVGTGTYQYIGIRGETGRIMMGLNVAGLSTGNSLVGDGDNNGPFMKYVLESFSSVEQVREYANREFSTGNLVGVEGCFPFVDALGVATMFEINGSSGLIEYLTTNPNRASQDLLGRVVRANEFHARADGTDNVSIARRYRAGNTNITGLISINQLSARTIMQGNEGRTGYEFMRYGPGREMSTLAARSVCSSIAVHAVAPGEDPVLTIMWSMLGHSDYSVSVPAWARVSDVPECLAKGQMATRANSLYAKGNEAATQASTFPFEAHLFEEIDELLAHWRSLGAPSVDEMTRVEHTMAADAYSLLDCLDNTQEDNQAPTVVLQGTEASGLTVNFTATAADCDGTIEQYTWAFGDKQTSSEPSPSHTFDAPGWYLVSCTVVDDDGVSTTDWQYIDVVSEPTTPVMLAGGGLCRSVSTCRACRRQRLGVLRIAVARCRRCGGGLLSRLR